MAHHPPPDRPARPRRTGRVALTATGIVVAVCAVATAGMGAWNYQVVTTTTGPVRQATQAYLHAVSTGDADTAYDTLCPATRDRLPRPEFLTRATGEHTVTGWTIDTITVTTHHGRPRGTVTTTLHRRSGTTDRRTLTVTDDGHGWHVCDDQPT